MHKTFRINTGKASGVIKESELAEFLIDIAWSIHGLTEKATVVAMENNRNCLSAEIGQTIEIAKDKTTKVTATRES